MNMTTTNADVVRRGYAVFHKAAEAQRTQGLAESVGSWRARRLRGAA